MSPYAERRIGGSATVDAKFAVEAARYLRSGRNFRATPGGDEGQQKEGGCGGYCIVGTALASGFDSGADPHSAAGKLGIEQLDFELALLPECSALVGLAQLALDDGIGGYRHDAIDNQRLNRCRTIPRAVRP